MVTAGTWVTVTLAGEVNGIQTTSQVAGALQNALASQGFHVGNVKVDAGGIFANLVTLQWTHYLYTASVTITAPDDYGAADDLGAIVAHALYGLTGIVPSYQTSVTPDAFLTGSASGGVADTVFGPGAGAAVSAAGSSLWQALGSAGAALQADSQLVVVGVVVIAVVLIYALAEGPNVKHLAKFAAGA